jgi:thiol-disulfide isomerase/thioredoxin
MMKSYFLVITLVLAFFFKGYSQSSAATSSTSSKNITVVDGSGAPVAYAMWNKMMKTGLYGLKRKRGEEAYYLYELSDEERARAEEKRNASLANRPKPTVSAAFTEGDKYKGDKITDVVNNKFDLRKPDGKIYVFNYWFISCSPCKKEIPELNQLVEKYKGNDKVIFLGVALDDAYSLKQFLKTTPFRYNIVDNGRYLAQKYGVKLYPTHAIVGKDGLIKFSAQGASATIIYWLEKTIEEQLASSL